MDGSDVASGLTSSVTVSASVPFGGRSDDRAVSVAVNHVLAIAITTIMITSLLYGAGNVLDDQSDRATQNQLRTIGDRLANQVTTAESVAKRNGGSAVVQTDHPRRIVGDNYRVELVPGGDCGLSTTGCLRLSMTDGGTERTTPVRVDEIQRSSVSGGPIAIVYDENGASLVQSLSEAKPAGSAPVPADDQPKVAPIGGAVGETRTQFGSGGGGGGGGGSAPNIDTFDVVDDNPPTEYNITWAVSDPDGDLDSVTVYVNDTTTGGQQTFSGASGSETTNFGNNNDDFEIKIVAVDTEGNEACRVVNDQADNSGSESSTTC
jgi:hypothetical protein